MPLISARMSASSSTTRMSCAMRGFHSAGFGIGIRTGIGFGGVGARFEALEAQGDARAAAAAILERQLPTMVLHDLLHDRQAQAGTAGARRDVRLGQAVALLLRQAAAIVLDGQIDALRVLGDSHADFARRRARAPGGDARRDRLGCVLENIDQRLADLARIAEDTRRLRRQIELDADVGARRALQESGLADDLGEFSSFSTGAGMRAKDENSSTILPISPTCRIMVSVQIAKVSGSLRISFVYLRFKRSAESWIGVSGFLISCAMRRATSAQAALRCAEIRLVTSSKVTT